MDWHLLAAWASAPIFAVIGYAAKGWMGSQIKVAQDEERERASEEFRTAIKLALAEFEKEERKKNSEEFRVAIKLALAEFEIPFLDRMNGRYMKSELYHSEMAAVNKTLGTLGGEVERLRDRIEEIQ